MEPRVHESERAATSDGIGRAGDVAGPCGGPAEFRIEGRDTGLDAFEQDDEATTMRVTSR